ncbi:hypothetical protein Tdes44962_MAKER09642 [Teratosphaeria destructans]|uniref:Uncharacterized protein n=1 Tax=Teratosphaeria destructans TaxID=418781 RepID=A0A9W7SS68_9PEZI|nr:hypothetical protein Tdes44962_MAKER09642 [Teratosphaeria destructans]
MPGPKTRGGSSATRSLQKLSMARLAWAGLNQNHWLPVSVRLLQARLPRSTYGVVAGWRTELVDDVDGADVIMLDTFVLDVGVAEVDAGPVNMQ